MGKASRNKRQSAREKIAAQQAAARRAEARKRLYITGGAVAAVAAVVIGLIVFRANSGPSASASASTGATGSALPASVIKDVTTVPAATLDAVGAGTGQTNEPRAIPGTQLTQNGKPEVLYMGAEYCPYCAAERWALTVALSRFGTFSGLRGIHSNSTDVYPSTPTLTYYKSTYTSKYLSFTPVELTTVSHAKLQVPTAQENALLAKYDAPPYVPSSAKGAIPFVDIANRYALVGGSSYVPKVLAGHTWSQVASALSKPSSPIAQQADGAANYLTAAFCKVTNEQPANVCTSPMIKKLQGKI